MRRHTKRLAAAAALCTVISADETVTLKRDALADEPEVQASMNSLGGAFMPAVGEDYENEAAKEAERVRLSQAAEQAEARARAEHAARLEEAQRQYAAQQQAAQTAALSLADFLWNCTQWLSVWIDCDDSDRFESFARKRSAEKLIARFVPRFVPRASCGFVPAQTWARDPSA